MDYLFLILDDVSAAIERLWELVPVENELAPPATETSGETSQ